MTEYPGHINEDAEFVPAQVPMIERVATAISNAMAEHGATPIWSDRMARAAIEAMREPSAEMVKDGLEKPRGMIDWKEAVAASWRAMIDAALKEGSMTTNAMSQVYFMRNDGHMILYFIGEDGQRQQIDLTSEIKRLAIEAVNEDTPGLLDSAAGPKIGTLAHD